MKRRRVIGLAAAAAICTAQASAEELTGTLRKIKETGAITLGYRDSSIPFSYLDDDQKPRERVRESLLRVRELLHLRRIVRERRLPTRRP